MNSEILRNSSGKCSFEQIIVQLAIAYGKCANQHYVRKFK